MSAAPSTSTIELWASWEGHVVNGVFPLRRFLGSSEHSGVFLTGLQSATPSEVAIKIVRAVGSQAEWQLSHWLTAASLEHPNLVRIFEAGQCQVDGRPYLYALMEYADQDLAQLLQRRALTDEEAREMLAPTLGALAFLHGKKFAQGRVKPSNVLVVGDRLKLASDTIYRIGEAVDAESVLSAYEPPELSETGRSAAADIWALGVTICEALTQRQPLALHGGGNAVLPMDLSPSFRELVAWCLTRRPSDRPEVAEIEAALRGERTVPIAIPAVEPAAEVEPAMAVELPTAVERAVAVELPAAVERAVAAELPAAVERAVAAELPTAVERAVAVELPAAVEPPAGAAPPDPPTSDAIAAQFSAPVTAGPTTPSAAPEVSPPPPVATNRAPPASPPAPSEISAAPAVPATAPAAISVAAASPAPLPATSVAETAPAPMPMPMPETQPPAAVAQGAASESRQPPSGSGSEESKPRYMAWTASSVAVLVVAWIGLVVLNKPSGESDSDTVADVAPDGASGVTSSAAGDAEVATYAADSDTSPATNAVDPDAGVATYAAGPDTRVATNASDPNVRATANVAGREVGASRNIAVDARSRTLAGSPVSATGSAQRGARNVLPASPATTESDQPPPGMQEFIPEVPTSASRTIRGRVRVSVRLIVEQDGTVFAALADNPGPSRYFERLAIDAAKKWTFAPTDTDEQRLMLVRFTFTREGTTANATALQ